MQAQGPRPPEHGELNAPVRVADLLRRGREAILSGWQDASHAPHAHPAVALPWLRDHFRELLDRLAEALEQTPPARPVVLPEPRSDVHAFEGMGPREVVLEYGQLRRCVRHHLEAAPDPPRPETLERLEEALDQELGQTLTRHALAREQAAHLDAQRSRSLMDTLLAAAPLGIAILDRQLRYLHINPLLAGLNGHSVEAHLGRSVREMVMPEAWVYLEPFLRRVLETGEPVVAYEFTTSAEGGPPRHWLANNFPVHDAHGELLGIGAMVMNITVYKEAEATLERAAAFREQLLAVLGHDLRNPLNAIAASAFQLARGTELEEGERKAVERIRRSSARMARMIDDILDFARSRLGGGIPVEPRPMDLAEACRAALEELQASHPERRLLFEARGDTRGEWDPDRVAQVVGNLVANALQHGSANSPVRVTARGEGPEVVLAVHNEGPPIPAALLPRLFDPFTGGERAAGSKSLGLGLFIVQQLARAHGGDVTASSTAEAGTTLTVRWPRHPVSIPSPSGRGPG